MPKKDGQPREQGKIVLCGVQGCCPTIDFTNPDKIIVKDDFGGQIQLTRAQWQDLKKKFFSSSKES